MNKNDQLNAIEYMNYLMSILDEVRTTDLLNIDKNFFNKANIILDFLNRVKTDENI